MNTYGTTDRVRRVRIRRGAAVAGNWMLLAIVAVLGSVSAWNWAAGMTLEAHEPLTIAAIVFNVALILATLFGVAGIFVDIATASLRDDSAFAGLARYPGALGIGYGAGLWVGIFTHPTVTDVRPGTVTMATITLVGGAALFLLPSLVRRWRR